MPELLTAIGLMSGTSMDGIDLAVVSSDGESKVERQYPNSFMKYGEEDRAQIAEAMAMAAQMGDENAVRAEFSQLQTAITERHARFVNEFFDEHRSDLPRIDLIGFHGQTILHRPDLGFTVQLGDGDLLAKLTGIEVAYDMRANDMAHGGQGAPLVPVYHQALALDPTLEPPTAFVNIGGISNVTYVGQELIAFDCGPGNNLIDAWMILHEDSPYDDNGRFGLSGAIDDAVLANYLEHPYFADPVPKSLDRYDFDLLENSNVTSNDMARTLARVTAEAIMRSKNHFPSPPKRWIISGGGVNNQCIMQDLKDLAALDGGQMLTADELGLDSDMMEAEAWAYLAIRAKKGLPLTYPKTTGCNKPVSGGKFALAQ